MTLDLGTSAAKRTNRDELLQMMRRIIDKEPGLSQSEAVAKWLAELRDHEDYEPTLREICERYTGESLWRRSVLPKDHNSRNVTPQGSPAAIIASEILLWTWTLPTTGKRLSESTFQEIADAAPVTGRFLARLATQGAPGALVKAVFKTKEELQAFWLDAQK